MKQKSMDEKRQTGKILLEIGFLSLILVLLCTAGIQQSLSHNWKIIFGGNLFPQAFIKSEGSYQITYLNQESLYISFLSVLFSFLGNKEEVVSIINLILQLSGVLFFYLGAKKLFHHISPLIIAGICGIQSSCFYPVIADTSTHMIWFLTGLMFWLGSKTYSNKPYDSIKRIFLGIFLGILCYIDLAGFLLLTVFVLFIFLKGELFVHDKKKSFVNFIIFILGTISSYFMMFYLWNNLLINQLVFQYWINDKLQYIYPENGQNQYMALGIVFGIIFVFYAFECFKNSTSSETTEDKHIETVVAQEKTKESSVLENNSQEVNQTEAVKTIKFIENPLPLPKKHVKKEMKYAFEPTLEQMHYDLNNYRIDDDYDLKDI